MEGPVPEVHERNSFPVAYYTCSKWLSSFSSPLTIVSFLTDLYRKILETTMTPSGIDTCKLYPVLMSSGLPRETLGQIWAFANRTTPGKLTKEELYSVLAMIAVSQVGTG